LIVALATVIKCDIVSVRMNRLVLNDTLQADAALQGGQRMAGRHQSNVQKMAAEGGRVLCQLPDHHAPHTDTPLRHGETHILTRSSFAKARTAHVGAGLARLRPFMTGRYKLVENHLAHVGSAQTHVGSAHLNIGASVSRLQPLVALKFNLPAGSKPPA